MSHFVILGSHPDLSLAELHAAYPAIPKPLVQGHMAVAESESWDGATVMSRLAGITKCGDVIASLPIDELTPDWLADWIEANPRAPRILFGMTWHGDKKVSGTLKHLPIGLKKTLKERDHSVRWVTGDQGEISPAAIAKMHLDREGYDFNLCFEKDRIIIGVTTHVQDADAWSLRDYGRPARDAKNGMLPPKLARMLVNIGLSDRTSLTLLDPFCGSGTVQMEALLADPTCLTIGSDISERMVADSKTNFNWMKSQRLIDATPEQEKLFVSPAEQIDQHLEADSIDVIVTEGYLGTPLRGYETQQQVEQSAKEIEAVWKKAIPSLAKVLKPGGRLVLIAPELKTTQGHARILVTNFTEQAGLTRLNPLTGWQSNLQDLAYARQDQRVKRWIYLFEKR